MRKMSSPRFCHVCIYMYMYIHICVSCRSFRIIVYSCSLELNSTQIEESYTMSNQVPGSGRRDSLEQDLAEKLTLGTPRTSSDGKGRIFMLVVMIDPRVVVHKYVYVSSV